MTLHHNVESVIMLSVITLAKCPYAQCHVSIIIMLNAIKLSVIHAVYHLCECQK